MFDIQLKELLDERGLKPAQLYREGIIPKATVYSVLDHRDRMPTTNTVEALCIYFGVAPSKLIKVSDELISV